MLGRERWTRRSYVKMGGEEEGLIVLVLSRTSSINEGLPCMLCLVLYVAANLHSRLPQIAIFKLLSPM